MSLIPAINATGLRVAPVSVRAAVFMQPHFCCPFLVARLHHFLWDAVLPGNELGVVRDGPRSGAPAPPSGLDRVGFCGSGGPVGGICGQYYGCAVEACWGVSGWAAAWCADFLRLQKCFLFLKLWFLLGIRKEQTNFNTKLEPSGSVLTSQWSLNGAGLMSRIYHIAICVQ